MVLQQACWVYHSRERDLANWESQSSTVATPNQEESVEVVRTPYKDVPWSVDGDHDEYSGRAGEMISHSWLGKIPGSP